MKLDQLEKLGSIAVVGATGIVAKEFYEILSENKVKFPKLKLLASERSDGEMIDVGGTQLFVEPLTEKSFEDVDYAFFSVPADISERFIPIAVKAGCTVVDDSHVYRMKKDVPLIVPEVNGALLKDFEGNVITTPNCSTTPLALCLKPLADEYGIKRVVVSTYQSVSGAGSAAFKALSEQVISLMSGQGVGEEGDKAEEEEVEAFPHRFAFNCIPQIGESLESGDCKEELKIVQELRKILELPKLRVSATTVRVPTFVGHGLSVNVELNDSFESSEVIRELFDGTPGLKVLDQPENHIYPTNEECVRSNHTFVGRIRRDTTIPSGLNFWIISDNLRKGAALNVLEILQTLCVYRSQH